MLGLTLNRDANAPLQILCLGAHSDDIEIGCGGTLLRLLDEYPVAKIHWMVFSGNSERVAEAYRSAERFLKAVAPDDRTIVVQDFADGFFPYLGAEIKRYFEELKLVVSPDLIFTHCRHDLHQDHRLINELTWNTFRDHLILEYEIPKYDGDLGAPNLFVHLSEEHCQSKSGYLMTSFRTQADKQWFTADTFLSIMRLRGIESRSPSRYAEAFYSRKLVYAARC
jgi:LmbE family N-acetylglucosaminyl deacetylase